MTLGHLLFFLAEAAVEELARRLPQPPAQPPPPTAEQRAAMHAARLSSRLWDRARCAGAPDLDTVGRLARHIRAEYEDGPDAPPLGSEVTR